MATQPETSKQIILALIIILLLYYFLSENDTAILTHLSFLTTVLTSSHHNLAAVTHDYASACYSSSLPPLTPNVENRAIPWGTPGFYLPNGTLCCDSPDQVRASIDEVDGLLLSLLARRVAYD
jgi:hypothetical protein